MTKHMTRYIVPLSKVNSALLTDGRKRYTAHDDIMHVLMKTVFGRGILVTFQFSIMRLVSGGCRSGWRLAHGPNSGPGSNLWCS